MLDRLEALPTRHFVTAEDIRATNSQGGCVLRLPHNCTVTDDARELALKLSVRLEASEPVSAVASQGTSPAPSAPAAASMSEISSSLLSDTLGAQIAEAIAAVIAEMQLGQCATALVPILIRRAYARLAKQET